MAFAPGGDPLGFLAAARDIRAGAVEARDFGGVARDYRSYTFSLNGRAFASYLQDKITAAAARPGQATSLADGRPGPAVPGAERHRHAVGRPGRAAPAA